MSEPGVSALILLGALALFVSNRVRHDLVALLALLACLAVGLVGPQEALTGFAAPAVITVAAVLVVGRAVELTGIGAIVGDRLIPRRAPFSLQLGLVLVFGATLSAFMNNIAALVLTIPIAVQIARRFDRSPGSVLMPLSFATILGGMTTLIGTPANLILSNIREDELGEPFGFFAMAPVGATVTVAGLVYLILIGWRLIPKGRRGAAMVESPWRVFELLLGGATDAAARLRKARARQLASIRAPGGDRLLVLSRERPEQVAERSGLALAALPPAVSDPVSARVIVANGSVLIGRSYDAIRERSNGAVEVMAAGPRAARAHGPLAAMLIQPGDQLFLSGDRSAIAQLVKSARLLELDRYDAPAISPAQATLTVAIYLAAVLAAVLLGAPVALAFLAAAVAIVALRIISGDEAYRSIDWSIIVLLAAMIPVGRSFESSGAAALVADWLGGALVGNTPFVTLAVLCGVTMLLSIFLNNVATAVIIGPVALRLAELLGISPDAALLAVLIGASSDFLTPIGHHNNTLVMGPGGYRFGDYARVGAPLVVIVVLLTGAVLSGVFA